MRPPPRTPSPQQLQWIPGNSNSTMSRQNVGSVSWYHVFPVNEGHPSGTSFTGPVTSTTDTSMSAYPTFLEHSGTDFMSYTSSDDEEEDYLDGNTRQIQTYWDNRSSPSAPFEDPSYSDSHTSSETLNDQTFQATASLDVASINMAERVAYPVYVLHCASCETFLTDRGMKAVLLLQDDVGLYSSDAFPANCGALVITTRSSGSIYASYYSNVSSTVGYLRSCECLTQELSCHGCGTNVAYHVVSPCQRCMQSVMHDRRSTNGHRYVFHQREVLASERRYTPGEPGVITLDDISVPHDSYRGISNSREPRDLLFQGTRQEIMEDSDSKDLINTSTRGLAESESILTTHEPEAQYPNFGSHLLSSSSADSLTPSRNLGSGTGRRRLKRGGDIVHWNELKRDGELPPMVAHAYGDKPWLWHVMSNGFGGLGDGER
ncbi:hypothetical protein FRC02_004868 [Tulasnella sp. 418]|nr:hypothetical protein FRC02_004868 [Tulasnella sp. 418]